MSTTTTKLGLKKPNFATDDIENTLNELADNFQKLDDDSDDYVESLPLSGTYPITKRFYKKTPKSGDYIGWVNTRTGTSAPTWQKLKQYTNGDLIVPTVDNGHIYKCIQTGYSGLTEPVFPVSVEIEFGDIRGSNTWQATTQYKKDDIVLPTIDNGRFYVCLQAGESGDVEPTWGLADGQTIYDKNASWVSYKRLKWKEAGVASNFRPYGKIE
ncbi:hypothetical protein [Paenibacillus polymyxa]|uniref:hypothetical protein n=1 Tax=Paenibacillus polymyxa TaxID=1406 RepID=UPI00287FDDF3|nr:hypothetical protein [Paenibacillus polymyxa]